MARRYFQENCTVFSLDADTGILDFVADATSNYSKTEVENAALMDDWENAVTTRHAHSVSFTVAGDTTIATNFITAFKNDTQLTLAITEGGETESGEYEITDMTKKLGDAITYDVTIKLRGDPT